jgi:subtilisin family serine protease
MEIPQIQQAVNKEKQSKILSQLIEENKIRMIAEEPTEADKLNFKQKGCQIKFELEDAVALACPKEVAPEIKARPDRLLYLTKDTFLVNNRVLKPMDIWDTNFLRAPTVWSLGFTGKDRIVAILDTGVDYTHPSLGACNPKIDTYHGEVYPYVLESPHPYPNNYKYTWKIEIPGLPSMSIHFVNISTESIFDSITVKDKFNNTIITYSGYYKNIWTPAISGDEAYITLETDFTVTDYGFYIDKIASGSVETTFSWKDCPIIGGYDFVNNDTDPWDDVGHGTHVAGIITSDGNPEYTYCYDENCIWNSTIPKDASIGIAPDALIMIGKVCDWYGCWESDIARGIEWAVSGVEVTKTLTGDCNKIRNEGECLSKTGCVWYRGRCTGNYLYEGNVTVKPDVISMSLGSWETWVKRNCDRDYLAKKVNWAVKKGVSVVVSAGNYPAGVSSPACASDAIAVGAIGGGYGFCNATHCSEDWYNWIAEYSGRGYPMEHHGVVAPGVGVLSTLPNNKYDFLSGTSMAAPYVSGLIALMKQKDPTLSTRTIRNTIFRSAIHLKPFIEFRWDGSFEIPVFRLDEPAYEEGHGRIDAFDTIINIR